MEELRAHLQQSHEERALPVALPGVPSSGGGGGDREAGGERLTLTEASCNGRMGGRSRQGIVISPFLLWVGGSGGRGAWGLFHAGTVENAMPAACLLGM